MINVNKSVINYKFYCINFLNIIHALSLFFIFNLLFNFFVLINQFLHSFIFFNTLHEFFFCIRKYFCILTNVSMFFKNLITKS